MARSSISIRNADCIAGMQKLADATVDLAFADPPFNIGYDYDVYHDKLDCDKYLAWCEDWTAEVVRLLKPDGTFWLAIGDEYAAELKVMLQRTHGLTCRSWVVWYYTFGVNCKRKFNRSHAHLFDVELGAPLEVGPGALRRYPPPQARRALAGIRRGRHPSGTRPGSRQVRRRGCNRAMDRLRSDE